MDGEGGENQNQVHITTRAYVIHPNLGGNLRVDDEKFSSAV